MHNLLNMHLAIELQYIQLHGYQSLCYTYNNRESEVYIASQVAMETIGYAYNGYTNTLYTAVCGLANYSYIL